MADQRPILLRIFLFALHLNTYNFKCASDIQNINSCSNATSENFENSNDDAFLNQSDSRYDKATNGSTNNTTSEKITSDIDTLDKDTIKVEFCMVVLTIPSENCTCNKSSEVCDFEKGVFTPKSKEQFCGYVQIPQEYCSCEIIPDVCQYERVIKQEPEPVQHDAVFDLIAAIITTISMVVAVTGNSAVLLVSFRNRDKLSKNKMVICLLAVADGLSSLFNFILTVQAFWSGVWPFGPPLCKVIFTGANVGSWFSIGFILTIAVERFVGILYPMKRNLQGSRMIGGCVALNVTLVVSASVPLLLNTYVKEGTCQNHASPEVKIPFQWCVLTVFMVLPTAGVVFCYLKIIHLLVSQTRNSVALSREDIKMKRAKDNRRTVKILFPVIVAFILCVLPMDVIELYFSYQLNNINFDVYRALVLVQNVCFPLHACVNPIIYTIFDRNFRNDLLLLLGLKQKTEAIQQQSTISITTSTV